jgi:hypothetical protein
MSRRIPESLFHAVAGAAATGPATVVTVLTSAARAEYSPSQPQLYRTGACARVARTVGRYADSMGLSSVRCPRATRTVLRMSDDELRRAARNRLKAKSSFWVYVGVWGAVALLLTAIWFFTSPGAYYWPVWPIFGMGVAALFIGLDAYGPGRRYYTEADVDAEIQRMTGRPRDRGDQK